MWIGTFMEKNFERYAYKKTKKFFIFSELKAKLSSFPSVNKKNSFEKKICEGFQGILNFFFEVYVAFISL